MHFSVQQSISTRGKAEKRRSKQVTNKLNPQKSSKPKQTHVRCHRSYFTTTVTIQKANNEPILSTFTLCQLRRNKLAGEFLKRQLREPEKSRGQVKRKKLKEKRLKLAKVLQTKLSRFH